LKDQVRRSAAFEEGWFDRGAVSRLVDDHLAGKHDWSTALWPLLAFGLWLDRVRDVGGD
jgi:asparagine synthase (glutamine-hydrolysing)